MERQSEPPRRFLTLKDFVASVPASTSKVRRMIKNGHLEYAQPDGPGTDIYIPEDAFERLVNKPLKTESICGAPATKAKEKTTQKSRSGPQPKWTQRAKHK